MFAHYPQSHSGRRGHKGLKMAGVAPLSSDKGHPQPPTTNHQQNQAPENSAECRRYSCLISLIHLSDVSSTHGVIDTYC